MTKEAADLLASCHELRAALAGAMRVMLDNNLESEFLLEMKRIGVVAGVGVRADDAIANAEKMP